MTSRTLSFDFTEEPPQALTVGQLGRELAVLLDRRFEGGVWVRGEVSGIRSAPSGHVYFALKDEEEEAVLDAAIYRASLTPRMRKLLVDGARVRVRARPSFWPPRGRLQIICDRVEDEGRGAALLALEKLKEKLAAEGLFDRERKRALPSSPRTIGVVTSPAGAVIHDIARVAFRRGDARILLSPAQVQGEGAAGSILRALRQLFRVEEVDVVILARGGGSQDDLAAFNDEALVRAVADAPIPVVSAVGHDVDVALTDFAADARAATPSEAAELVVVDRRAARRLLRERSGRLVRSMRSRLREDRAARLDLDRRLGDPRLVVARAGQRLDDRARSLAEAIDKLLRSRATTRRSLEGRLSRHHPLAFLARERAGFAKLEARLVTAVRSALGERREHTRSLVAGLDAMSPLKVLARGYVIARAPAGRIVRHVREISPKDTLDLRIQGGSARVSVVSTTIDEESE